jgi:hypothetical protein
MLQVLFGVSSMEAVRTVTSCQAVAAAGTGAKDGTSREAGAGKVSQLGKMYITEACICFTTILDKGEAVQGRYSVDGTMLSLFRKQRHEPHHSPQLTLLTSRFCVEVMFTSSPCVAVMLAPTNLLPDADDPFDTTVQLLLSDVARIERGDSSGFSMEKDRLLLHTKGAWVTGASPLGSKLSVVVSAAVDFPSALTTSSSLNVLPFIRKFDR